MFITLSFYFVGQNWPSHVYVFMASHWCKCIATKKKKKKKKKNRKLVVCVSPVALPWHALALRASGRHLNYFQTSPRSQCMLRALGPLACISKTENLSWGQTSIDAIQTWTSVEHAHRSACLMLACTDRKKNQSPRSEFMPELHVDSGSWSLSLQILHQEIVWLWYPKEQPMRGVHAVFLVCVMACAYTSKNSCGVRVQSPCALRYKMTENEIIFCGALGLMAWRGNKPSHISCDMHLKFVRKRRVLSVGCNMVVH